MTPHAGLHTHMMTIPGWHVQLVRPMAVVLTTESTNSMCAVAARCTAMCSHSACLCCLFARRPAQPPTDQRRADRCCGVTGDKARRRHAAAEKAAKLKSPNFCVSPTRLHLANIPKSLDDKALKQLLVTAVSACKVAWLTLVVAVQNCRTIINHAGLHGGPSVCRYWP